MKHLTSVPNYIKEAIKRQRLVAAPLSPDFTHRGGAAMVLPNIVFAFNADYEWKGLHFEVGEWENEYVRNLVFDAALKHFHLTFIIGINSIPYGADTALSFNKVREASGGYIYVVEDGVVVGKIGTAYRNNEDVVALHNSRINRALQRGTYIMSADTKRLLRELIKHFYKPTPQEYLLERASTVEGAMDNTSRELGRTKKRALDIAREFGTQYLLDTWDVALPAIKKAGASEAVDNLLDKIDHHELSTGILNKHRASHGYVIAVKDDKEYFVQRANKKAPEYPFQTFTTYTLPVELKRSLGLLKVAEEGVFIRDVGYKAEKNLFYVIAETTKED